MAQPKVPIMSTAGAVPIKNEKGQISMEKVKVSRYVTGKRPEYAPDSSDEEDEQVDLNVLNKLRHGGEDDDLDQFIDNDRDDRRLRRLQQIRAADSDLDSDEDREARVQRHRRLQEPEILDDRSDDDELADSEHERERVRQQHREREAESEEEGEDEEEEELDEEEIERRRNALKQKVKSKREEELLDVEDEKLSEEEPGEAESSEYEEYSDSEEEDLQPRLKPVFVRKRDRITIKEKESEQQERDLEAEKKRLANERRAQTLKLLEAEIRREAQEMRKAEDTGDGLNSGDENDEEAYEAWKTRELKRIKRSRDEREKMEREKQEIDRLHHMTEEERRMELKNNPKVITNKMQKGKYKFLQKYYHRGAFFLDKDENIFQRNFSEATLEDHFDKTVLPKVMQVKNFGRSGRTKYTHLVDQDTTSYESPWVTDSAMNLKFHNTKGGGMKQVFERPAVKKRK